MKTLSLNAIKNLAIGSVFALIAVFTPIVLSPATSAACDDSNLNVTSGINCAQGEDVPPTLFGEGSIFTTIVNVLLFLIGAISVIMLIIGGLRYVISAGNSTQVTAAKNTILYAIVGLVIAFLAFAAVNFVINTLAPGSVSGGTNV